MTATFVPVLDKAVLAARGGKLSMQAVLWTFAASTVFVPSVADPGEGRCTSPRVSARC